jgi:mRNA interferase MazF
MTSTKNKEIKRGEVYWVNLDPAIGSEIQKTRPAVIIV